MTRVRVSVSLLLFGLFIAGCITNRPPRPDYPLQAVPLAEVEVADRFWAPKMEINRAVSILHCLRMTDETGSFDVSKLIEGAAYMLALRRDPTLEALIDQHIDRLVKSLESRITRPEQAVRISGHYFEAAAAYYEATGKKQMLDSALKLADLMDRAYGPGRKTYISGHEGLKIGLIRLYRLTGNEKYWKLARFFLDERGQEGYPREGEYARDRTYAQDHKPVVQQAEAVGHAVRAMFLYIPLTGIAALTGRRDYLDADGRIWEDVVSRKMYLTGGVGSVRFHEQFGAPYQLPNLSAWNETCAAYGNVVWNHRLFLLRRDAKYIDVMERVLYNAFLVGVSLNGDRFFYQNPLMSYGNYERFSWINVPCCPPNVVRLLASIGAYVYARDEQDLYVNLFIGSRARVKLGGTSVGITQQTRYPWEGDVKIAVHPERPARFALHVRIPGWARNQVLPGDLYRYMDASHETPILKVNGRPVPLAMDSGYARVDRTWRPGDNIELQLPMPVRKALAHPKVQDDQGRVALMRGPLIYCAEWPDNGGQALNLLITDDTTLSSQFRPDLLNGVQVITGKVLKVVRADNGVSVRTEPHDLVAIPYYGWANRGMGEMAVWVPRREDRARLKPVPPDPVRVVAAFGGIQKAWTGYNDQNDDLAAVYDGADPLSSADQSNLYFRMRPPTGKPAWIEYRFRTPATISSSEVYWVDDNRFCRVPGSWRILYQVGTRWQPVLARDPYRVEKDTFNRVTFDPVTATAVRLEVEPQKVLYRAGQIGPPAALFLRKDTEWREFGVIEWRVHTPQPTSKEPLFEPQSDKRY
jgi:hypothetical protein